MQAFAYRVRFYYTSLRSSQEFWNSYGKNWSHDIDKFASPSPAITDAAKELTSGAATQDEKLNKLYDAVMKLDNTRFSREHSKDENRAEGVKHIKSAPMSGPEARLPDDLAMLFLALARAAGFHADAMAVVNRNRDFFQQNYLDRHQLDDLIVLVTVDGKERAFDPGERYTTYGTLHWTHALAGGLRQQDGHTALANSPGIGYKDTIVQRIADLTLAPDGTVTGSATIICTGQRALHWRQKALEGDQVALKKDFDDQLQPDLPPGVIVKTDHFLGLDNEGTNLMVRMKVSGSLGTATGKRIFLPLSIFAAGSTIPSPARIARSPSISITPTWRRTRSPSISLPDFRWRAFPPMPASICRKMRSTSPMPRQTARPSHYSRNYIMANILYTPRSTTSSRASSTTSATRTARRPSCTSPRGTPGQ